MTYELWNCDYLFCSKKKLRLLMLDCEEILRKISKLRYVFLKLQKCCSASFEEMKFQKLKYFCLKSQEY